MTDTADLTMGSIHGEGFHICGIAPRVRLSYLHADPCWNCNEVAVVQTFSGSGWYEDEFLCSACGEDVGTGYRPFQRAWRKKNIERAQKLLADAIPYEEFKERTSALIQEEMGFDA